MALASHQMLKQSKPLLRDPKGSCHRVADTLIIRNDKGLHTRPSTELVRCATKFQSHIQLVYQGAIVNGKSLLGILMLAAGKGAKITVEAAGIDAKEAVAALLQLAKNHFYTQF